MARVKRGIKVTSAVRVEVVSLDLRVLTSPRA